MHVEDIEQDLSKRLSNKRFIHTLGVVEAARSLARQYRVNEDDAQLAALLHDCGKELPLQEMQDLVKDFHCDEEMFSNGALLHGLAGMVLAQSYYGITNPNVLEAIRVHTTGKPNMSELDKIIFLADYIEKNRVFPGVDRIRYAAQQSLNEGVLAGYDMTIRYLLEQGLSIYALTILGRNDILQQMKGGERRG